LEKRNLKKEEDRVLRKWEAKANFLKRNYRIYTILVKGKENIKQFAPTGRQRWGDSENDQKEKKLKVAEKAEKEIPAGKVGWERRISITIILLVIRDPEITMVI
jgi:hypothetical protein